MSYKKPMNRSDYISSQEKVAADAILDQSSHDEIARLAYLVWEASGGGDGEALDDWLQAERLLQLRSKAHAA